MINGYVLRVMRLLSFSKFNDVYIDGVKVFFNTVVG